MYTNYHVTVQCQITKTDRCDSDTNRPNFVPRKRGRAEVAQNSTGGCVRELRASLVVLCHRRWCLRVPQPARGREWPLHGAICDTRGDAEHNMQAWCPVTCVRPFRLPGGFMRCQAVGWAYGCAAMRAPCVVLVQVPISSPRVATFISHFVYKHSLNAGPRRRRRGRRRRRQRSCREGARRGRAQV